MRSGSPRLLDVPEVSPRWHKQHNCGAQCGQNRQRTNHRRRTSYAAGTGLLIEVLITNLTIFQLGTRMEIGINTKDQWCRGFVCALTAGGDMIEPKQLFCKMLEGPRLPVFIQGQDLFFVVEKISIKHMDFNHQQKHPDSKLLDIHHQEHHTSLKTVS